MIQAVQRLRESKLPALEHYRNAIRLTIGLFCNGIYSPDIVDNELLKRANISKYKLKNITQSIKENKLFVTLSDGTVKDIPLSELQKNLRKGCAKCEDALAEVADIAVGPIGAKNGYSTIIVRTNAGESVLVCAERWEYLQLDTEVDMKSLNAAKEEKDKRKRAQMFDSLQIMMLDALADPTRIEEAKKRFGEIYSLKSTELQPEKKYDKTGCGTCSLC